MRTYTGETGERFWEMTVTVRDSERPEQMADTLFYDTRDSLLGERADSGWDTWFGLDPDQCRGRPLFEWGHSGTPARRLAAAVLMDHLSGTDEGAEDEQDRLARVNGMYQDFASERIAKLADREQDPLRRWEMGSEEVARWINAWEVRPSPRFQAEGAAGPPMEPCRKRGARKRSLHLCAHPPDERPHGTGPLLRLRRMLRREVQRAHTKVPRVPPALPVLDAGRGPDLHSRLPRLRRRRQGRAHRGAGAGVETRVEQPSRTC